MKTIPRYWSYARTGTGVLVWRSSSESEAAARFEAEKAAQRITRIEHGEPMTISEYPYGVTIREKLLGEFDDTQGQLQGFVTRNHTGAEVLNVKNVMFLDWDTEVTPAPVLGIWETLKNLFVKNFSWKKVLLGRGKLTVSVQDLHNDDWSQQEEDWADHPDQPWENTYPWAAVAELAAFMSAVTQWPDWSVRIYKTCAGYRGLVTHDLFDPTAESTLDLMRQFRCDPQYTALCKRQESFRARMTPKKWRCKLKGKSLSPSFRFHYPGSDLAGWPEGTPEYVVAQNVRDAWAEYDVIYDDAVQSYEQASAEYATCRYLGTVGRETIHPDIAAIIGLHDEMTKALSENVLTLA